MCVCVCVCVCGRGVCCAFVGLDNKLNKIHGTNIRLKKRRFVNYGKAISMRYGLVLQVACKHTDINN